MDLVLVNPYFSDAATNCYSLDEIRTDIRKNAIAVIYLCLFLEKGKQNFFVGVNKALGKKFGVKMDCSQCTACPFREQDYQRWIQESDFKYKLVLVM